MDKLTVLNNALITSGNNSLNALNDGSDEWDAANTAFGRALAFLVSRHNWPFATAIVPLSRVADDQNTSRLFSGNGFQLPDHFHLVEVYHDHHVITDYEIIGSIVSAHHSDGIFAKIVRLPADASWHPLATEIMTLMVESGVYRSLNEDMAEAKARWAQAEDFLLEARPRVDQENPARNGFKSSIRAARGARRR